MMRSLGWFSDQKVERETGLEAPSTNQALSSFIASLRTTVCTTMITVCMIIAWQRT